MEVESQVYKTVTHAKFELPKVDPKEYASNHPFRNKNMHKSLLDYLTQRLELGKQGRDARIVRYGQIDRDVAAFLKLSPEDQKRAVEHAQTGDPKATKISLPLMLIHLTDMMTYYAQTFAPNRGMFYHTAKPDEAPDATQLVSVMNSHAVYGGFYRQLLRAIFAILKYNIGGVWNTWDIEYGPKLEATESGGTQLGQQVTFKGNKIKAVDMYNFLYDPGVDPARLYEEGEFAATCELRTHYWLQDQCLKGTYLNCADILHGESMQDTATYYKDPPVEARLDTDSSGAATGFSWLGFIKGQSSTSCGGGYELTTIYCRLNPNQFNLIAGTPSERAGRDRYEVWKFTILGGQRIIQAEYQENMHGHIPVYMGVLNDDEMEAATKSVAEVMNPLQQFASFLLNVHVEASRKNLHGTTYYDPSCVDMEKIPKGEVAARVPIKPQGYGKDIRTMVQRESGNMETSRTLQDLQGMMALVDQFYPTQSLPSQIAGIDRAVTDQVAAVQQGSNRRQHMGARLIDDTMLRPMRFSMYYNIVQFQEDGEEIADYYTGRSIKLDLNKLKDTNLSLIIGQGLKALDRQAIQQQMREIIFAMIQAPAVSEQIDLLGMLDAWTSMMDLEMNLKQFQKAPPPPEGASAGLDLPGTGILPATSPENIAGGPIYD